ncbi:V8-like Glu-specific endopeptidase [Pseudomonas sp. 22 E 5]|nr:V8-like Glu-specific endopeptidase [Pseudomonas sp. 22 E 5]
MKPESRQRYSRLQPLSVEERGELALHAFKFFSPSQYSSNLQVLGLPNDTPRSQRPFSTLELLTFLEKTGVLTEPMRYVSVVKSLLDTMEREGLLVAMSLSNFVMAPKTYYAFKELTGRESRGMSWLAPVLGPEFLHSYHGEFTVHIIGDSGGDERGGTGFIISDRHVLTCAHVLKEMMVRTQQTFQGIDCEIKACYSHESVDVGIIELSKPILRSSPSIGFRDPVIGERLYLLGYPPVPMSCEAPLILQGGEIVNEGVADIRNQKSFLYSAIARPGNSGGPVISHSGHILGIVTEDRVNPDQPHALFYAGISTSTIASALAELPICVDLPIETYE